MKFLWASAQAIAALLLQHPRRSPMAYGLSSLFPHALVCIICILLCTPLARSAAPLAEDRMVGLYIHQHWPYEHPYAARTWTYEDWYAFARDLRKLGYNTLLIWPVIETMPDPPTASDRASLEKLRRVIRSVHEELDMRVLIVLCPNVGPINDEAASTTFERRHFFYTDRRIDPTDRHAMKQLLEHRRRLLEPLKDADGVLIIDSDPGGYPGSTNAEFVDVLAAHRRLLDELRPGIELFYWMHAGWEAYSRYYETASFTPGTPEEFEDTLRRLDAAALEPWGIATARLPIAERAGLGSRVVALNYGRIESEPSFPLSNFGGDRAYEGGASAGPRGVIGNAQTHCVQLPNIFAFARGSRGQPVAQADYVAFANRLVVGQGPLVVQAWQALAGEDADEMRRAAEQISSIPRTERKAGDLSGLLFGSAERFFTDLILQLRFKAAAAEFMAAVADKVDVRTTLGAFVTAAEAWQGQHGYENRWRWPELQQATETLEMQEISEAWEPPIDASGFDKVRRRYYRTETMTPRILRALRFAWERLSEDAVIRKGQLPLAQRQNQTDRSEGDERQ